MELTGKNWVTSRQTYASTILSTTYPTWVGLGWNLGLCITGQWLNASTKECDIASYTHEEFQRKHSVMLPIISIAYSDLGRKMYFLDKHLFI